MIIIRRSGLALLLIAIGVLVVTGRTATVAGNRSFTTPATTSGPAPDAAVNAVQAKPPASTAAKPMTDHFGHVALIESALIRGDLEAAQEAARWIVAHQQVTGMPAGSASALGQMKSMAQQVSDAKNIAEAAAATGGLVQACGACHVANKTKVTFEARKPVVKPVNVRTDMMAHQRAVDDLYRGLVGPSETLWAAGAEALKTARLENASSKAEPGVQKEVEALAATVHALGTRAVKEREPAARAEIYGKLLGTCAECHHLMGKVFGAGIVGH